ncbi:hypothetical protein PV08_07700 [Exophiala spinifera]|uniref:Lipocalin/cytosolic fatty-acid binding domain-containing protein n=1 Tax=Exophiala spinifera TaxID=91928 RepID=A0A0D2B8C1_9EURO|nr:uncharacterized protein PV08_07700 [Exophiala spinifera]KIW14915.1 hypothetical protein PV08_07700 [Exophiala spinifera]
MATTRLNFRAPSTSTAAVATVGDNNNNDDDHDTSSPKFTPPSASFLHGKWYVTHSTLPMWKTNRNVTITYTPLPNDAAVLDDLVEYQPKSSDRRKKVKGYDTPSGDVPAAYGWRGKGWLMIASSKWQVIGYGDEDEGWCVTYFEKTLFTPAGIDVYSRRKTGASPDLLSRITEEMKNVRDGNVRKLAADMFAIDHTG